MPRSAIIAAVIGVLLMDPLACRASHAERPCASHPRAIVVVHGDAPDREHEPAEPCDEASHGCVCQGATAERAGDSTLSRSLPDAAAIAPALLDGAARPRPRPASTSTDRSINIRPGDGRAVRIAHQSFLT